MPDRLDLAGQVVLPLLDERLGHGGDGVDRAVEPEGRVDAVGQQVAGDARAGRGDVEPPEPRAPLGQVGRDRPVLEEVGPVVEDPAQPALVDQLLGQRDGGHAAVVVPDRVRHAGLLDGVDHLLALDEVHRQRLLAEDHLARLRPRRWRSRRACCWACRCRSRRCPSARSASASRSRPTRSPSSRRTPWRSRRRGRRRP